MNLLNQTVLMSGTDYFAVEELNPYSHEANQPNKIQATEEFTTLQAALESAGINIRRAEAPVGCQDGVYTANWALCRGDRAILSSLPHMRSQEELYARQALEDEGFEVIPSPYLFSGQGDALPCGNTLFAGQKYRTDPRMHQFIAENLGYEVISLETVPVLNPDGSVNINGVTGLPNSYFYDLDLALAVLREDLIAWCPTAFTLESQAKIQALDIDKIEVDYPKAVEGFACNLVSTGETVIMSDKAPKFRSEIEDAGLAIITPDITELAKGGGYIRCTTLTLDNPW